MLFYLLLFVALTGTTWVLVERSGDPYIPWHLEKTPLQIRTNATYDNYRVYFRIVR